MVGVILAGGRGSRLTPITKVVDKTLLPVGKYPMIYYSMATLAASRINRIVVVLNEFFGHQVKTVLNKLNFIVKLSYVWQKSQSVFPAQ